MLPFPVWILLSPLPWTVAEEIESYGSSEVDGISRRRIDCKVRDTIKDMGRSLVEQTRSYMIASCIGGTQLSSALQSVMHRALDKQVLAILYKARIISNHPYISSCVLFE
ncbi:hypothetical protein DY000_02002574 [Brassica cretica]|uniref:DNA-directed RNA polymerase n=1 Tax=Brassica cretica TaxID=69181 RepID=A0ABQ7CHR9_BRACR|nr:hypothetical protein DY000_02002574 [Brassica cretica]